MSRGIPDGKHSEDQLIYSRVKLAVQLEGDVASRGTGSVGSDVFALKAHKSPQQVFEHCTAGDVADGLQIAEAKAAWHMGEAIQSCNHVTRLCL